MHALQMYFLYFKKLIDMLRVVSILHHHHLKTAGEDTARNSTENVEHQLPAKQRPAGFFSLDKGDRFGRAEEIQSLVWKTKIGSRVTLCPKYKNYGLH